MNRVIGCTVGCPYCYARKNLHTGCEPAWTPVTHTITFEKADLVRVFEDTILSFSCSRNAACAK